MIELSEVTAVIVTRGNVPLDAVLDSLLPYEHVVVWDNSKEAVDYGSFGRCVGAALRGRTEWVYFQDDDLIVRQHGGCGLGLFRVFARHRGRFQRSGGCPACPSLKTTIPTGLDGAIL